MNINCVICSDLFVSADCEVFTTPCGHIFHHGKQCFQSLSLYFIVYLYCSLSHTVVGAIKIMPSMQEQMHRAKHISRLFQQYRKPRFIYTIHGRSS